MQMCLKIAFQSNTFQMASGLGSHWLIQNPTICHPCVIHHYHKVFLPTVILHGGHMAHCRLPVTPLKLIIINQGMRQQIEEVCSL